MEDIPATPRKDPRGGYRMPEALCLECGAKIDGAGDPENDAEVPTPGAWLICIVCGGVMALDDDYRPRMLTTEERRELARDLETMGKLRSIQRKVHFIQAQKARLN